MNRYIRFKAVATQGNPDWRTDQAALEPGDFAEKLQNKFRFSVLLVFLCRPQVIDNT